MCGNKTVTSDCFKRYYFLYTRTKLLWILAKCFCNLRQVPQSQVRCTLRSNALFSGFMEPNFLKSNSLSGQMHFWAQMHFFSTRKVTDDWPAKHKVNHRSLLSAFELESAFDLRVLRTSDCGTCLRLSDWSCWLHKWRMPPRSVTVTDRNCATLSFIYPHRDAQSWRYHRFCFPTPISITKPNFQPAAALSFD